jgi:hypothetical protein
MPNPYPQYPKRAAKTFEPLSCSNTMNRNALFGTTLRVFADIPYRDEKQAEKDCQSIKL